MTNRLNFPHDDGLKLMSLLGQSIANLPAPTTLRPSCNVCKLGSSSGFNRLQTDSKYRKTCSLLKYNLL